MISLALDYTLHSQYETPYIPYGRICSTNRRYRSLMDMSNPDLFLMGGGLQRFMAAMFEVTGTDFKT